MKPKIRLLSALLLAALLISLLLPPAAPIPANPAKQPRPMARNLTAPAPKPPKPSPNRRMNFSKILRISAEELSRY